MPLRTQVEADVKQAMRDRNDVARDTLRMVLSEMKRIAIDGGKEELSPEEELAVVQKAVKVRQEGIEQAVKAGRSDLETSERAQLAVLMNYLPKQLSESDVRASVQSLMKELNVSSKKDLGALMKALMARHKGQVDGKTAQRILSEMLA
ncbi:MAG: GatB/YqeY domain-containing protein [Planctomycetota bacterium]